MLSCDLIGYVFSFEPIEFKEILPWRCVSPPTRLPRLGPSPPPLHNRPSYNCCLPNANTVALLSTALFLPSSSNPSYPFSYSALTGTAPCCHPSYPFPPAVSPLPLPSSSHPPPQPTVPRPPPTTHRTTLLGPSKKNLKKSPFFPPRKRQPFPFLTIATLPFTLHPLLWVFP